MRPRPVIPTSSAEASLTLRERRQRRTRDDAVDAVLGIIAEDGVEGLTIERVSVESGISRGTIYAHFPSGRDELLRAAYARIGHHLIARTEEEVASATDWLTRVVAHARAMFEFAADPQLGYFYNVSGPALIKVGAERGIGSSTSIARIGETLASAQSAGEIAANVDPSTTAMLLVGALREAAIEIAAGRCDAAQAHEAFVRLAAGLAYDA